MIDRSSCPICHGSGFDKRVEPAEICDCVMREFEEAKA